MKKEIFEMSRNHQNITMGTHFIRRIIGESTLKNECNKRRRKTGQADERK